MATNLDRPHTRLTAHVNHAERSAVDLAVRWWQGEVHLQIDARCEIDVCISMDLGQLEELYRTIGIFLQEVDAAPPGDGAVFPEVRTTLIPPSFQHTPREPETVIRND